MKKLMNRYSLMAALVAVAVCASARSLGTWEYPVLNGQSSQTLTWAGPATFSGSLTQTGNQTGGAAGTQNLNGTGAAATYSDILGIFATPSTALGSSGQTTGVNVSTMIPVNSTFEVLTSSGGNLLMTAAPAISSYTVANGGTTPVQDGAWLILTTTMTTSTITFQSNGTLSGSGIFLGANTRAIALHSTLGLQFVASESAWEERFYNSNAH